MRTAARWGFIFFVCLFPCLFVSLFFLLVCLFPCLSVSLSFCSLVCLFWRYEHWLSWIRFLFSSKSFVACKWIKSVVAGEQRPPGGEERRAGKALRNRQRPQPPLKLQGQWPEGWYRGEFCLVLFCLFFYDVDYVCLCEMSFAFSFSRLLVSRHIFTSTRSLLWRMWRLRDDIEELFVKLSKNDQASCCEMFVLF